MANVTQNSRGVGILVSFKAMQSTIAKDTFAMKKMIEAGCPVAEIPPHQNLYHVPETEIKFNTFDVIDWMLKNAHTDGEEAAEKRLRPNINQLQSKLHKAEAELAQRQLPGPKPRAPTDYDEARARATAAQADLRELDLRKKRAEVVAIDDVMYVLADQLASVRTRLLAIPARVAPEVLGVNDQTQIIQTIRRECISALAELSVDQEPFENFLDEKDRPGFIDGFEGSA